MKREEASDSSSKESKKSDVSSSQKSQPKNIVGGPRVIEPVFEQREPLDDRIKSQIILSLATFTDETPPTRICETLKGMLDSKFGKGWCVFAGAHFAGSCTFEEKYFAQISFGTYSITAFRIFIPGS
ncbi:dynein light chain-like protein [Encephalitozoon hellem ATCC 50504]|uniref:Dynein light chain 1 n=1 Tax=Encephalitozoon hellem TaxID=27973 RepID=A0A9Q9C1I2_ENCHE|nr:dynein light chain-like protein [Encephalitozoon hellem ATCC 50504]AFM97637.1 dynein light chain-like protein [Encephalitozoon hellem ATCC 50504]UTX42326.1 dynein light chain 1 [Encephalitozoon hellem]WEL37768.1 dynein light chain 1 [Encephalitozoon hellem]|eukprot:XP_003886618.1 dynein light chain-like protein [Encephalitozoon hellem ATCC 50504]